MRFIIASTISILVSIPLTFFSTVVILLIEDMELMILQERLTVTKRIKKTKAEVLRDFGRRLSREMKAQSISQAELARRTEISPALVFKYCSGKSQPSGSNLVAVASALGVHPSVLYSDPLEDLMSAPEVEAVGRYFRAPEEKPSDLPPGDEEHHNLKNTLASLIARGLSPSHALLIYHYESLPSDDKDRVNKLLFSDLNQLGLTYQALGDILSGQVQDKIAPPIQRGGESVSDRDRLQDQVIASFASLDDIEVSVVAKYYSDELSISEIAKSLQMSEREVEKIRRNAFRKIQFISVLDRRDHE